MPPQNRFVVRRRFPNGPRVDAVVEEHDERRSPVPSDWHWTSGASTNIWIVDSGTDRVYQYDGATTRTSGSQSAASSFALASGNTNPQGIADPPPPTEADRTPTNLDDDRLQSPTVLETSDAMFVLESRSDPADRNDANEKEVERLVPVLDPTSTVFALTDDATNDEPAESTDDTPLAILPDDEYDGLFAELDGSVLDELLMV